MRNVSFLGFRDRLKDGDIIIGAEGYLFEFERRGYLKAGAFVPEVVIEHPELVKAVHEEYVHAGSDVVEAFTVSIGANISRKCVTLLFVVKQSNY